MVDANLMTGLGAVLSIFFSSVGASVASMHAGILLVSTKAGFRSFAPIIISGVLAIYGIIVAVILAGKMNTSDLNAEDGYRHFAAGLAVGLTCMASGFGIAGFLKAQNHGEPYLPSVAPNDVPEQESLIRKCSGHRGVPQPTIKTLLVLVFLEAIGLYGLIVGLVLAK